MKKIMSTMSLFAGLSLLGLQGCASNANDAGASAQDAGDAPGKAYVTGSRLPYKVGSNMSTEYVKGVSREGFKDDMNEHKMPHRVGN